MLIVGRAGTGKTEFARQILWKTSPDDNLLIIDPKDQFNFPGSLVTSPYKFDFEGRNTVRYAPAPEYDNMLSYNVLLERAYRLRNVVILIDETFALSDNGYTYPASLKTVVTRGRSYNVTVIMLSQRPKGIPTYCRSEVDHYVIFDLGYEGDRKAIYQEVGKEEIMNSLPLYHFRYYDKNNNRFYKSLNLKLPNE